MAVQHQQHQIFLLQAAFKKPAQSNFLRIIHRVRIHWDTSMEVICHLKHPETAFAVAPAEKTNRLLALRQPATACSALIVIDRPSLPRAAGRAIFEGC